MATTTNKGTSDTGKEGKDAIKVIKTPVDLQRLKLEKLMKNPTKEVIIPEASKDKAPRAPLEFIRNIWGSSAGAGSGDFHVYRGVRRREYARQKYIKEKGEKEELDEAYRQKVEQNKKEAEERTAKKRAKRLKKKQKLQAKQKKKNDGSSNKKESESEDDSDESGDEEIAASSTGNGNSNSAADTNQS